MAGRIRRHVACSGLFPCLGPWEPTPREVLSPLGAQGSLRLLGGAPIRAVMGPASPCWGSLPSAPPLELRHLRGPSQAPGPPDGPTLTPDPHPLALPACCLLSSGGADGLVIPDLCLCRPVPSLYPQRSAPSTMNFPSSPHTFWLPTPPRRKRCFHSRLRPLPAPAHDPPSPTIGLPLSTAPIWHLAHFLPHLRKLSGSPSPWASPITPAVSGAIAEALWPLSLMETDSNLDFRPLHGAMELPGQHFWASVSPLLSEA